jgi:hypothetical protein
MNGRVNALKKRFEDAFAIEERTSAKVEGFKVQDVEHVEAEFG